MLRRPSPAHGHSTNFTKDLSSGSITTSSTSAILHCIHTLYRQFSLMTSVPFAGVLYLRFGSDSHQILPFSFFRINLNSNVDAIGNSTVTLQFGLVPSN